MSNKTYDTMKWVLLVVVPAVIAFMTTLGTTFGWTWIPIVNGVLAAAATMVGSILQIDCKYYNKAKDNGDPDITIRVSADGTAIDVLVPDEVAEKIAKGETVVDKLTCVVKR